MRGDSRLQPCNVRPLPRRLSCRRVVHKYTCKPCLRAYCLGHCKVIRLCNDPFDASCVADGLCLYIYRFWLALNDEEGCTLWDFRSCLNIPGWWHCFWRMFLFLKLIFRLICVACWRVSWGRIFWVQVTVHSLAVNFLQVNDLRHCLKTIGLFSIPPCLQYRRAMVDWHACLSSSSWKGCSQSSRRTFDTVVLILAECTDWPSIGTLRVKST